MVRSVESAGPHPLWLGGAGGDLGLLHHVRVVGVVVSTLGHLVRTGALPVHTRPGPWNMSTLKRVNSQHKTGTCQLLTKSGNTDP